MDQTNSSKNSKPEFSIFSRVFATAIDLGLLLIPADYLLEFINEHFVSLPEIAVTFIIIYILLYSFLQYKNWIAINFLLNKKIVKQDGSNLNFFSCLERTIIKMLIIFAYSLLITLVLFPPTKDIDEGLSPVDKFCETKEV
jgi:hypothetical protein